MTLQSSDFLIYPSRVQTSDVLAGLQQTLGFIPDEAREWLPELEAASLEGDVDFAYSSNHSANETNFFRDPTFFKARKNGFGIGVTGEAGVDGPVFPSWMACARFFVAELRMKLRLPVGAFADARQYAPQKYDDVQAIVNGSLGTFPSVSRISDLGKTFGPNGRECVWFCDSSGADAIVQKARALIPNVANQSGGPTPVPTPSKVTFGNVEHPNYIDRLIPSSQNSAWDDLGPRTVRGIVWHRMLGSLDGTDGFFRGGAAALTDYGTGVSAQDGAGEDGLLDRWNDPQGRRSPWANGALSQPYGDGLAFYNIYGVNAINRDLTAIEISGFQTTPVSAKARRTIVELTAYWADQYHVSWETFPLIPSEGNRSFVLWHQEITLGTGKLCPFDEVIAQTNSLIAETKAYLKSLQTDGAPVPVPPPPKPKPPKPPKYPRPILPLGLHLDIGTGAPHDHVADGVEYRATKSVWRANRRTRRMQQPIEVTEKAHTPVVSVGPSLEKNTALTAWWETERTLITRAGTSFYKNAFRPITVAVAKTLRATEHPIED